MPSAFRAFGIIGEGKSLGYLAPALHSQSSLGVLHLQDDREGVLEGCWEFLEEEVKAGEDNGMAFGIPAEASWSLGFDGL